MPTATQALEPLREGNRGHANCGAILATLQELERPAANQLRHGSEILERLIQHDGLLVVGAEYSLETGVVQFFDGVPVG